MTWDMSPSENLVFVPLGSLDVWSMHRVVGKANRVRSLMRAIAYAINCAYAIAYH